MGASLKKLELQIDSAVKSISEKKGKKKILILGLDNAGAASKDSFII